MSPRKASRPDLLESQPPSRVCVVDSVRSTGSDTSVDSGVSMGQCVLRVHACMHAYWLCACCIRNAALQAFYMHSTHPSVWLLNN